MQSTCQPRFQEQRSDVDIFLIIIASKGYECARYER